MERRIGLAHVEANPDWASMTPDDFEAWTTGFVAGKRPYPYHNLEES